MAPLGFDIIDVLAKSGRAYDSTEPHRHTFFELFFFETGQGTHEIDFNSYSVEKSSVHFVSPGQIHHLSLKNTKGYVLCFTEDFIALKTKGNFVENFPFYDNPSVPFLKLDQVLCEEIGLLIRAIDRDIHKLREDSPELLQAYLNVILLKIRSFFIESTHGDMQFHSPKKEKVRAFKKMVEEHYLLHQSVSDYALKLSVSPNYLNALCKKHEGKTATQLIQERLLLESKRLLYATEMSVKEISFHLQFEDVPYFNRFFKKQTALTPMAYRHQISKNN